MAPSKSGPVVVADPEERAVSTPYNQSASRRKRLIGASLALLLLALGGTAVGLLLGTDLIINNSNSASEGQEAADGPNVTAAPSPGTPTSSLAPSASPQASPTLQPSRSPLPVGVTRSPTSAPTTTAPTLSPSVNPTPAPSLRPTKGPTIPPTPLPTTASPTVSPTQNPTKTPTLRPSKSPSKSPTKAPTFAPVNYGAVLSRCKITMQVWDEDKKTPGTTTVHVLGANSWARQQWLGDVNADDDIRVNVDCDLTCNDAVNCVTGSPLRQALDDLQAMCISFGWADVNGGTPTQTSTDCIGSAGDSSNVNAGFGFSGDVNSDDRLFWSAHLRNARSNSPMHNYLKTCWLHARYADSNGSSHKQYAKSRFDGTCATVTGSENGCINHDAKRWLWFGLNGDVNSDDRLYFRMLCGSDNNFPDANW